MRKCQNGKYSKEKLLNYLIQERRIRAKGFFLDIDAFLDYYNS